MANPPLITVISKWKRIRGTAFMILFLSVLLGLMWPIFDDGFSSIFPFINGFIVGLLGGIVISIIELYIFYPPIRKFNFYSLVITKVIMYAILFSFLILSVILSSRSLEYKEDPFTMFYREEFQSFLSDEFPILLTYTLTLVFIVIFLKEINRKVGKGILSNFITGKYFRPRKEERIFLFIDLDNSTTIAEEMDDLAYHNFLNEFFKDITDSILYTKGEIYQYVGDEVVVTWTMEKGLKDANCVYTFFYAWQSVQALSKKYVSKYGTVPSFKAALHCGNAIRGEVGDVKSEIVFHGDVLNTTSRIERLCSKLNESLLISEDLLLNLPDYIKNQFTSKGKYKLTGKEKEVETFGLLNKEKLYLEPDISHLL